jgi:hypothetical protein
MVEKAAMEIMLIDRDSKVVEIPTQIGNEIELRVVKLEKVFLRFPEVRLQGGVAEGQQPPIREVRELHRHV